MKDRMSFRRWVGVALLATAAGCATRSGGVSFHDPNMDFSLIQTVAVLPFVNLTPNPNAADRVRDVFMTMLQATGGLYVLPAGEVGRGLSRGNVANPTALTAEEAVELAKIVKADVLVTGTVREYGEVRSGTTAANLISLSVQMVEAQTGKTVWTASAAKGGIGAAERLFGGGGQPMEVVTEDAIKELLDQLFSR